jgi:hypothetical protein
MSGAPFSDQAKSSTPKADMGGVCGVVQDAVDLIKSVREGENEMPEPPLVGHGERYGPDDDHDTCGEDHEWRVCDNCGTDHKIGSCCDRWECPRCYKRAVLQAAISIVAKLVNYRDKYSPDSNDLKLHRVIIVPPVDEDFSTVADPLDKFYDVCGDLLVEGGEYHGGVRIPHPYRHDDEFEAGPDADDRDLALVGGGPEDDDRGLWKQTTPDWEDDHTPDWSDTREKLVHEPHMHCYVVASQFSLPTAEIYEETGWFIRRLEPYESQFEDSENHVSCYDVEDLVRSVMYALSHTGDYSGRDHYRFFGATANEPASESQKARVSSIARQWCEHIIGLPTSSVQCERNVADEDIAPDPASSTSLEESSTTSEEFDESDGGDEYMACGGSLVSARQIPDLIEGNDWSADTEQRLKVVYAEATGKVLDNPPPPD